MVAGSEEVQEGVAPRELTTDELVRALVAEMASMRARFEAIEGSKPGAVAPAALTAEATAGAGGEPVPASPTSHAAFMARATRAVNASRAAGVKSKVETDDTPAAPMAADSAAAPGGRGRTVARAESALLEPGGWLPVLLPGEGAGYEVGENPYFRPPPGVEFNRPQLYSLFGDEAYEAMRARRGGMQHELRLLTPLCFYMQNQLAHMERDLAAAEFDAEHERWSRHYQYLGELLVMAAFRQDFLTLTATEEKLKPELVMHMRNVMDGTSVRMKTASARDLVDDFLDRTHTASAQRAATSWANRSSSSAGGGSSGNTAGSGRGRGRGQYRGGATSGSAPGDSGKGDGAPRRLE